MLPIFMDKNTSIQIELPTNLKELEMKVKIEDGENKKLFLFPDNNPEEFEIIIRKKDDDKN